MFLIVPILAYEIFENNNFNRRERGSHFHDRIYISRKSLSSLVIGLILTYVQEFIKKSKLQQGYRVLKFITKEHSEFTVKTYFIIVPNVIQTLGNTFTI